MAVKYVLLDLNAPEGINGIIAVSLKNPPNGYADEIREYLSNVTEEFNCEDEGHYIDEYSPEFFIAEVNQAVDLNVPKAKITCTRRDLK